MGIIRRLMIDKKFLLMFLFLFFVFECLYLTWILDFYINDFSFPPILLIFTPLVFEFTIVSIIMIFYDKNKYFSAVILLLCITFIGINFAQMLGLYLSREFLSPLAVENIEFIGLVLTYENIITTFVLFGILIIIPLFIVRYVMQYASISYKTIIIIFFTLYSLLFGYTILLSSDKIIIQKNQILTNNHISKLAPFEEFIKLFIHKKEKKITFNKDEVDRLIKLGYSYNPFSDYPFVKNSIYHGNPILPNLKKSPNIILIFTEGFSAVTTNVYNDTFKQLTPNLKDFSDDNRTSVVENYYNHTAATYRGLLGQLCSFYPWLGGGKYWLHNNTLNLSQNDYKCLPSILKNNGYYTGYLNMHYKDSSGNDEIAETIGFDSVLSGEYLSKKYLNGLHKIKKSYLSDQQAYNVLIRYLKDEVVQDKPFLLTTYTVETHAFVDVEKDDVKYKDDNNVLNTIHNMDNAFGKFWNYFKHSKYAENTIIIFTSDHAHYYDKEYIATMKKYNEKNYHNIFIDRVPLLIYTPKQSLPLEYNAKQSTSIDLTPTVLHLVNAKQEKNSFIGHSIFERKNDMGVASYGSNFYLIKENNLIYSRTNVLDEDKKDFELIDKYINKMHELEKKNKIFQTAL